MATSFTIGAEASCTDGVCGEVSRVVLDLAAWTVTHLVVKPKDERPARLVALDLIDATAGEIRLRCTLSAFCKLGRAEKTEFVPGTGDYSRHGPGNTARPNFVQAGTESVGVSGRLPQTFTYDTLPPGEVAVRRGDHVHATDGDTGQIQGVFMNPGSDHVTHVLLQKGHLWGRKQVAIPISAVTRIDAGIELNITRRQVKHLPPVNLDHHDVP